MESPHQPPSLAQIARSTRERLELNRLFGWTVPLRREALRPGEPAKHPGEVRNKAGDSVRAPAAIPTAREEGPPGGELPPAFAALRAEVEACEKCGLCRSRTQTVFGVGNPGARLMFVGEAPGFDEDKAGEPFVGKAGQLLNDIIRAMGLRRSDVYIANIVKCRPPGNRTPDASEVGFCVGYLERQIDLVRPEVLVALGAVAAKSLLKTTQGIKSLRGKFHAYLGIPLMPTFHPAYLLRQPEDKRLCWEDIQQVMAKLGLKRPSGRVETQDDDGETSPRP